MRRMVMVNERGCGGGLAIVMSVVLSVLGMAPAGAGGTENEAGLRRVLAWQVALDAVGFSPGVIDGRAGPKTQLATREFQRVRGLPMTGELDEGTAKALEVDPGGVIGRYAIRPADLAEIGPAPTSWLAKSKLSRLGHDSLEAVLAEKAHCAEHLLRTLNPGVQINALEAGDKVVMPLVREPTSLSRAAGIEIDLGEKVIRVVDGEKKLAGMFHCSVAKNKEKLPHRDARIECVVHDPTYNFDPAMWPEVAEKIDRPLLIPPGPRNPVGRCWMGLSLPGYGMHGTPNPELIGKTGSHGCIRLANWDAIRLGRMVEVGTPVRFVGHPDGALASRGNR